jgi:hypothetical protein
MVVLTDDGLALLTSYSLQVRLYGRDRRYAARNEVPVLNHSVVGDDKAVYYVGVGIGLSVGIGVGVGVGCQDSCTRYTG